MMPFFDTTFLHNTVRDWLSAAAVTVVMTLVLVLARALIYRRVLSLAKRTKTELDDLFADLIRRTQFLFLLVASLYAGASTLDLPADFAATARVVLVVALLIQIGFWGNGVVGYLIARYVQREQQRDDAAAATTINALGYVGKTILWVIILLVSLDNLPGVEVTALIASLGVGGIAVALAVQNILGDLFASLSIVLDRPFVIGDLVIVDDYRGTIEQIGLKTTRVRSLSGEQLIFSNSDLLSSRIRNFRRMLERRIVFTIGVTYQTPYEKLAAIPGMIGEIVAAQANARLDRVHFMAYGDFSLNFEIVYFVTQPDYLVYADTQQAINLAIYRRFQEEGIEFAYPTQTVFLESPAGEPSLG